MDRAYSRINWENEPSLNTPLGAVNLNRMDLALYTIDGRVVGFDTTKANQSDLLQSLKSVDYNTTTGVFTFTYWNGTVVTADLNIEKIPVTFTMSPQGVITMTTADGTQYTADVGALIKTYTFVDSSEIDFTVTTDASGNKTVTAGIVAGSITANKLQPNFLADCQQAKSDAESAATSAEDSEEDAEAWSVGTINGQPIPSTHPAYENYSKWWALHGSNSFAGLTDTEINNVQDGQVPVYDGTANKWKNRKVPSGGATAHLIVLSETGSTVKAVKGQKEITATETSTGHFECDLVMDNPQDVFGTWTIHAVLGGDDAQVSLNVDTIKVYTVDDSHFHADITVTYPTGATVSCSKTGEQTMYATGSPYTFTVHSTGVWTITGTRNGVTETQTVTITINGQEESITLTILPDGSTITPTDDVQILLNCADIWDKTYTTISQLIADDTSLLKVFTTDNAIDYLVRSTTFASAITADEDAMSMIGSYDYASDTLTADATWATAINGSTYASSVANLGVPQMTGNTTPSGECIASGIYNSTYDKYKAFDKNSETEWASESQHYQNQYVGYDFKRSGFKVFGFSIQNTPQAGTGSSYPFNDFKLQGYDTDWHDIQSYTNPSGTGVKTFFAVSTQNSNYSQYRIYGNAYGTALVSVAELAFLCREKGGVQSWLKAGNITDKTYTTLAEVLADSTTLSALIASQDAVDYLVTAKGLIDGITSDATAMSYIGLNNYCANTLLADAEWCNAIGQSTYKESVLNVKAPTMTGYTAPSGQVVYSSDGPDYGRYAWKAYDKNNSTFWESVNFSVTNQYNGYIFPDPVAIVYAEIRGATAVANRKPRNYKVQASEDGTTNYVDLTNAFDDFTASTASEIHGYAFNSSLTKYRGFRWFIGGTWGATDNLDVAEIQFYGREDV